MKKKLGLIGLSALMVMSTLAGCGSGSGSVSSSGGGKKPKLTVSVFAQEHEQEMYKTLISDFEEENDCVVDFQVAGDQYWPELEASLTANTAPDVFYLGVGDVKKRVWLDKVAPLDELLDTSTLGEIWPEALNLYRYDEENDVLGEGPIYALPKDFSAVSMAVNKAIIEKRRGEIEALIASGDLPFFPEIDGDNLPVYTFTEFATLCSVLTFEDDTPQPG